MASIRRRKGPRGLRYVVLYRDRTGAQRSETFRRLEDASRRKSQVEVDVRDGTFISPREARITFGEWYTRWEATRTLSATRTATDSGRRDKYVLPRWKRVPLDAITHMEASAWVASLNRKMGAESVRACFRLLKLPMDAAVLEGKIRVNPVLGVKLPPVTRSAKTADDVLTADELSAVIAKMPERWQALVFVCGWLGARWSEALGLRRCDINPMRSELTIGRVTVVEPGCKTLLIKEGGKSANAVRTIPLPATAQAVLLDHMAAFCADQSSDAFIFLTEAGTHPYRTNFRRVYDRALREAGINKHVTLHGLRHSAASIALDAGVDLQDVSKRLGHARPSITLDIYAHLLNARREAGTAAMEAAMRLAGSR